MASSYSTDLKLELMVTGEKAGLWGDITNTNLNLVQQAIAGFESISIAGGAQTTTLVMTDATLSNARNAVIKLTGTITGNQVVTIPTGIEKTYIVSNGTVGAFTVEFKQAGGTGTTFSTTDKGIKILFADGTNIVDVNANFSASSFNQINLPTQNELRFEDSTGGQYVALKAGATVASNLTFTLPTADGSNGQALVTNGSGVLSFADAGLAWQSVVTTSTITVVAGRAYFINTTSNACTVTLPSTPTAGQQVQLVDYAGTFDTNAVTINPNGNKIEGGTSNLLLTGEREGVILTYIDSTQGWLATSGINEGTDALSPAPYSVDFLVIGGGGGGGYTSNGGGNWTRGAGGGGAGGFRTSTQSATVGTVITVTVGDGGAGGSSGTGSPVSTGTTGSASSISGSGLTTISSAGGGGGGGEGSDGTGGGKSGGSGGGAGGHNGQAPTGGSGNTPSTSPSQGNNGGTCTAGTDSSGSGGGGAGGAGTGITTGGSPAFNTGAAGGAGTASSITGSSVTRAGGGGGGGATTGGAGTGGGGTGGGNASGTSGTANLGGGGGGAGATSGDQGVSGGTGGKGVVILSVPTANYSSTTTGSPTVSTSGSNTIMIFTGSGSYTA
jgi:hypothetical protein